MREWVLHVVCILHAIPTIYTKPEPFAQRRTLCNDVHFVEPADASGLAEIIKPSLMDSLPDFQVLSIKICVFHVSSPFHNTVLQVKFDIAGFVRRTMLPVVLLDSRLGNVSVAVRHKPALRDNLPEQLLGHAIVGKDNSLLGFSNAETYTQAHP